VIPKGAKMRKHFWRALLAAGGLVGLFLLRAHVVRGFISLTHTAVRTERACGCATTPGQSQDGIASHA